MRGGRRVKSFFVKSSILIFATAILFGCAEDLDEPEQPLEDPIEEDIIDEPEEGTDDMFENEENMEEDETE